MVDMEEQLIAAAYEAALASPRSAGLTIAIHPSIHELTVMTRSSGVILLTASSQGLSAQQILPGRPSTPPGDPTFKPLPDAPVETLGMQWVGLRRADGSRPDAARAVADYALTEAIKLASNGLVT